MSKKIEKLNLSHWLEVKKHSRILYVKIPSVDCDIHDIRSGDKLHVSFRGIIRAPRDQEEG